MVCRDRNWAAFAVLLIGVGLRVGLAIVAPPELANDDHFTPIRKLLDTGHLPAPDACWECYQPPLYYVVSAGVMGAVEKAGQPQGVTPGGANQAAKKAVQFESVVFGCATLVVCWSILRRAMGMMPGVYPNERTLAPGDRVRPAAPPSRSSTRMARAAEAMGLAIVALLPQHIYMSAMATNDALTYLLASLAIWAALRAHAGGWRVGASLLTGALCGAAVLSKGYGMVTAAVVVGTVALSALAHVLREAVAASNHKRRERKARDAATPTTERLTPVRRWKALALVMVAAVAVGIWPSVRNLGWCGRPLVDNFDIWPGRMEAQPPGSVGAIEWASFRLPALLRRPWVHMTQVNSFWTELYGRLWFEYEGIVVSLRNSPEWAALRSRVQAQTGNWASKEGWRRMLSWEPGDTPTGLRRVAVASYLAGLPLTAIVLGGLVVAVRRMWTFAPALLVLHFAGCLFVPIYQTVRLPHFAAMKPVFALGALSSAPVFAVLFFGVLPRRARAVALVVACAAAVTLVIANVGYIVELGRQ